MASARVEQTLERFQEDERLTSDLTDTAATALLGWIEQQVMAADAIGDEQQFERQVAAIRSAARTAASADDPSTAAVVERAQAALQAAPDQSSTPAAAAPASALSSSTPAADPPASSIAPSSSPAVAPAASQPSATAEPGASPDAATNQPSESLLPAGSSFWRTLRRRVRRWTHRKAS